MRSPIKTAIVLMLALLWGASTSFAVSSDPDNPDGPYTLGELMGIILDLNSTNIQTLLTQVDIDYGIENLQYYIHLSTTSCGLVANIPVGVGEMYWSSYDGFPWYHHPDDCSYNAYERHVLKRVDIDAAIPPLDTDGDGLPDQWDPWPDDPEEHMIKVIALQRDGSGNLLWIACETEGGGRVTFGEYDELQPMTIVPAEWVGQDTLAQYINGDENISNTTMFGEGQSGLDALEQADEIPIGGDPINDSTATGFEPGQDSTDNTTDTDHLTDIVNNTKILADNQARIGDYIQGTNQRLEALISKDNSGGTSVTTGDITVETPTAAEIASAIDQNQDQNNDELGSEANTERIDQENAWGDPLDGFDSTYTTELQGEEPEQSMTEFIDEKVGGTTNPISSWWDNQNITFSGDCSFTWDYKGTPITFTVCAYQQQLAAMGVILQALAALSGIMIVVRR